MKFLVTGATGQLGREWVRFLREHQFPFNAFSSTELDITDRKNVDLKLSEVRPDILINCAAYTNVDGAESESQKAFEVNETGIKNLAEACESVNAKFIHYSTDYVFRGSKDDQDKYPNGYPENAETDPINTYGKSKEAGEKVLQHSECNWLLIRVSWLCGQYGSNFVKTMLRLGHERDELSVVDDQIGCPSLAFDVVEKTCRLLHKNRTGTFHVSCSGKISWADFAEEIFHQKNLAVQVNRIFTEEYPFKAERPAFSLLSNKKAESEGLRILPWKEGLKHLLEQLDENPG